MTDRELADAATAHLRATTTSYPAWLANVRRGKYTPKDGSGTEWGKAFAALAAIDVQPTPPIPTPLPPKPPVLFSDGFETQGHNAWAGGSGGRERACDCTRVCPGGTPDTTDPLDSYLPDGAGYYRRTILRPECKSLNASCLNSCGLIKDWPDYKLGQTEFLGQRVRVASPYVPQTGFCLLAQPGYCQVKFNALGLNLLDNQLHMYCNLGYSSQGGALSYENSKGYTPRAGYHPVDVDDWHDYVWQVTYATTFTTGGRLRLSHRKPATSPVWSTLFDSDDLYPEGVPTRQWGYGLGNDTAPLVDVTGVQLRDDPIGKAGQPRKAVDKIGAYRGDNPNTVTIDHRKYCVADSFAAAEAYLDWPG